MFESNVGYGQNIAMCVRNAIKDCTCCIAVITRESIASLWVLTELHNALSIGRPCVLVLDASDDLLLNLLRSLSFHHPEGMFDTSVEYDEKVLLELEMTYAKGHNRPSRLERYASQTRDFLATLPLYLDHLTTPAFAYPSVSQPWSGPLLQRDFAEIRDLIYGQRDIQGFQETGSGGS